MRMRTFYVGTHADADSTKRPRNVIKIELTFFYLFHSFPSNVSVTMHTRIPVNDEAKSL
jgi:hypothetical protein